MAHTQCRNNAVSLQQSPAQAGQGGVRFVLESPSDRACDELAYACVDAFVELGTVTTLKLGALWSKPLPHSKLNKWLVDRHPDLLGEAKRVHDNLENFLRQERAWFAVDTEGNARLRVENMQDAFQPTDATCLQHSDGDTAVPFATPVSHNMERIIVCLPCHMASYIPC